jgi:hypothetical protein
LAPVALLEIVMPDQVVLVQMVEIQHSLRLLQPVVVLVVRLEIQMLH